MTAPTIATAGAYYALDAAYRAATAQTALAVIRVLQLWWTSVDSRNFVGTSGPWLDRATATVLAGQVRVAGLADAYSEQVRRLSIPGATPFTWPEPGPPNIERVRKSLLFTGIRETAREIGALDSSTELDEDREAAERTNEGRRKQLMADGLARASGSAIRLVNDAGHQKIEDNARADRLALGWTRTTKPGCCFFCAMLASRGYVYKEDSFAESDPRFTGPGSHKVHDNCGCGLRPFYGGNDPLPDRTEEFEQLWINEAARYSGSDAINAFRRAYEKSPLAQPGSAV